MWIHLLALNLIAGAGGQVEPPVVEVRNAGGIDIAQRVTVSKKKKPLDYREQLKEVAKQLNKAKPANNTPSTLALQALENMRSIQENAKAAQLEMLREFKRQEQIELIAEEEQIVMILTLMA